MKILEAIRTAVQCVRALSGKKKAAMLVIVGALMFTALHILSEGDAFQTAEVLLAIIFFW